MTILSFDSILARTPMRLPGPTLPLVPRQPPPAAVDRQIPLRARSSYAF
ncbi:MAG: hypothetical protein MZV70_69640 [Desulfobacterales bacterium]|nr:hypothetical protein [Desulfobacterales bacterium]